jgi:uncharacterized protein
MIIRFFRDALVLAMVAVSPAIATSYREGAYAFNHYEDARAVRILGPLAAHGDPRAQALLGFMYANGRGVPQNQVEAAIWYRRAADQGNPTAQYMLGLLYDKGMGVPQSDIEAYKWLNLAVAGANPGERIYWVRIRDAVASKLTRLQLADAQWLALQWRAVRER